MTIKKLVLLFIGFFSFINLFSQEEVVTTVGKTFDIPKGHCYMKMLGDPTNGFAQLSIKTNEDILIQEIDATTLAPTKEKRFDLSNLDKDFQSDYFFRKQDGNYFWFYSYAKKGKTQLRCDEFDIKTKNFLGNNKLLIETTEIEKDLPFDIPSTKRTKYGYIRFNITESLDNEKILVKYDLEGKNLKRGFYIFNNKLDLLRKQEFEFPYDYEGMDEVDYFLDKEGNVYFLIRVYDKKLDANEADKNCNYELYKFGINSEKPEILTIETENKYFQNLKISENNSGNIIIGGYYADEFSDKNLMKYVYGSYYQFAYVDELTKGLAVFLVNGKSMKKSDITIHDYKIPNDCYANSSDNDLNNIDLKCILVSHDNALILVGEKTYKGTRSDIGGNGNTVISHTESREQIIVSKVSRNNTLEWCKIIPKQQNDAGYIPRLDVSFYLQYYHGSLYFFYDTYVADKKSKSFYYGNSGTSFNHTKWCLNYVRISNEGDVSTNKEIFECEKVSRDYLSQVSENRILIQGGRRDDSESKVRFITIN